MQGSLRNVVQLVPMLSEISEVNGYSDNHRLCPILFLVCDRSSLRRPVGEKRILYPGREHTSRKYFLVGKVYMCLLGASRKEKKGERESHEGAEGKSR